VNNFIDELRRRNVFRVAGVYAVIGWVLAQISTTLEEALGLPVWFDAAIVAVLLLGLPIALVLAWAFELTPDGVLRTEAVPVDESITAHTGRKLDYAIIGGLVLLGTVMVWQGVREPAPERVGVETQSAGQSVVENSIAVLPFDDLSPEGDQEYFSDGIAEEILNVLVGVEGLKVSSRTSSFQFKGRGLGIPEIAAELKVRHVVEGSVRKAGNTIRVTAQLIDAEDDKHLWSDTFDRPLSAENIFVIQDEIARSIVVALGESMGLSPDTDVKVTVLTDNLGAYELFLKARTFYQARQKLDEAATLIARVVELDPGFAKAWEIRAALPQLLNDYGYGETPVDEIIRLTIEYANRALELDPTRATAIAALAMVRQNAASVLHTQYDLNELITEFDRALEFEPRNASALTWRGSAYLFVGDLDAALRDYSTCLDVDPYYVPCVENHFVILMSQGRDEEAVEGFRQALNQGLAKLEYAPIQALARLGEELAFKSATNHPGVLLGWRQHDELYDAYRNLGVDHSALAESIFNFDAAFQEMDPYVAHSIVVPLGAYDVIPVHYYMWDESHKYYRRSPQFKAYMKAAGVFDYWHKHGFPPQCRPVGSDDFDCD
jgi:TolB-like protein